MDITPERFNQAFGAAIEAGGDTLTKLAQNTQLFVQHKLRENSFFRKILPPETVTERECQRSVNHDSLTYVDEVEPDSVAMHINWRGEPEKTYVMGRRYEIPFHTISSDEFVKTESELRAYRMPIMKVIEQNIIKDIQEQEDVTGMKHVRAALTLATRSRYNDLVSRGFLATTANFADEDEFYNYLFTQNKAYNGGAWPATGIPTSGLNLAKGFHSNLLMSDQTEFNRIVLRDVVKVAAARQQKARCFLMHEYDFTDTVAWSLNEAGLEITSEIVRDGYKYTTMGGYTFVTTVRDNPKLVQPGQIFCFPAPNFLGRFLILDNTKFFIDRRARVITMQAWEEIGAGFGNILGISCILLRGADINIPVVYQDPAGTVAFRGTQRVINDPTLTSLPAPF